MSLCCPARSRPGRCAVGLALVLALSCALGARADRPSSQDRDATTTRRRVAVTYALHYVARAEPPAGTDETVLWLPIPLTTEDQITTALTVSATAQRLERGLVDAGGQNRLVRARSRGGAPVEIRLACRVIRLERLAPAGPAAPVSPSPHSLAAPVLRWLSPPADSPIPAAIAERARALAARGGTQLDLARRLFDWTRAHMRYDKSRPGWGRGDAGWACESGYGNCTDYHALLMALARASGLPARFHMGIGVGDAAVRRDPGYHCWASVWIAGLGWWAVDASEADKHPERAETYFGHLPPDRIELTRGRALRLPGQRSPSPLTFLSGPYLECDGVSRPDRIRTRIEIRRLEVRASGAR
ncbi:MAG: hypothetical protein D6776_12260 [Planctomycetota bacterium]|nr:MAG: hypothetical protein D6776_12260 [Planctomycetota bacterium]